MKKVFVIMPFSSTNSCTSSQWDEIYFEVFKPTIESLDGYECHRAKPSTGSLIKSIIEDLYSADLVLADLTDNNPNVFYELGVRHSLSKRTILVTQDYKFIPSDLRGYWSLIYGVRPKQVSQFRVDLTEIIVII